MSKMDDERIDNLIEETLSGIDRVEPPSDLHFDAAQIIRDSSKKTSAEPLLLRWRRYAAIAAAFFILLGVYSLNRSGVFSPQPQDIIEDHPGPILQSPQYHAGYEIDPQQYAAYEELLAAARQDETLNTHFSEYDKGFGYVILSAEEAAENVQFMIYFYQSEDEKASGFVDTENIRSLLWKKES